MKRSSLAIPALLLISVFSYPSCADAETLNDALYAALSTHPSVDAAQAGEMTNKDKVIESRSNYYPEISASATGGRMYGDNATSRGLSVTRGAGYSYLWEGNLAVTQRLFDGFETRERVDAEQARYRASQANILDVREGVALKTVQAYLDVMRTQQVIGLINSQSEKIRDYMVRIDDMVTQGVADAAELKQAEDILLLLDNLDKDFKTQYRTAQTRYIEVTGHSPSGAMAVPDVAADIFPTSFDQAWRKTLHHPALEVAAFQTQAVEHEIDAERGTLYPDINGELSVLKRDQRDLIGGEVEDRRAVVKMSWNFSTGGAQFARIRQKQSAFFESQARGEALERELKLALEQAWTEYEVSGELLENAKSRQLLNEELLDTYHTQFEGAQIRLLQLMQGENQLFMVKLERINTLYRHHQARFSVLANMGALQDMFGVEPVDDWYRQKSVLTGVYEQPEGVTPLYDYTPCFGRVCKK